MNTSYPWTDAESGRAIVSPLLRVPEYPEETGSLHAWPGRGAGGRWRGLAGLRDDAPSEARGADDSRAGHRHRHTQRPGPEVRQPAHGTPATPQTMFHVKHPAPLPRIAGKVAHLTYTDNATSRRGWNALDSTFTARRDPGLVRENPLSG